jgi:lysyl-tRNA synthetase class 1
MSDIKQLIQDSKAWPFELAKKILQRLDGKTPKKGYVLFETGYGPSGLPHIGTYCEVVRTQMVRNAFEKISDIPTKLIVVSDDMDGMRKIPGNLPNTEMLESHIQKPLTEVPDPFGEEGSYGEYMNKRLRGFLSDFDFEYEFHSATDLYKTGKFDEFLLKALEKYDQIMSIMLPTLGEERQQTYSPFLPICARTGRVLYVPVVNRDVEKGTISYLDPDTNEEIEIPVTGGHCKLQWKPDFGMRWAALDVDFEMYGKDHLANSKLYRQICRVVGGKGPTEFCYEMFLDEHGKKISKSKGNGVSIEDWMKYAPVESLSFYMFQTPNRAKKMYFSIIPKSVDEYITFVEKYHEAEGVDKINNPAWHIHNGDVPKYDLGGITFNLLLNLACVSNPEDKNALWGFIEKYATNLNREDAKFLDRLAGHAVRYYKDFVKANKKYRDLEDSDIALLEEVKLELMQVSDHFAPEEIQSIFYRVGKSSSYENLRDFFKMIYEGLLGQEQGPRLGSFVKLYGVKQTIKLIEEKIKRD